MLLPYTTLTYYGPGAGAGRAPGAAVVTGAVKATGRVGGRGIGQTNILLAKATRLVNSPGRAIGASTVTGLMRARARIAGVSQATNLTQDDVTGAVLEAFIEPGLTLKQALRLTVAALAGKVSGAGGSTVTIRNPSDTKDRIVASVDTNGNRTAITTDMT